MSFDAMIADLRAGAPVADAAFDRIYRNQAKRMSDQHWTPVSVAYVAAKLLVRDAASRILDIGSGAGKFCQIGALVTDGRFVGIEQRLAFVQESQRVAELLRLDDRAEFLHGNMEDIDWTKFSGIYLFNPFLEHVDASARLDKSFVASRDTHARYVQAVQRRLRRMPVGTRVATYHGFGGAMPEAYECFFSHEHDGDYVRAWLKAE